MDSKEVFIKNYKRIEELHGREVSELDTERVWSRYKKIYEEPEEPQK